MQLGMRVVLVGHDNSGARKIIRDIVKYFDGRAEILVVETKGLFHNKTLVQSVLELLLRSSISFSFRRFLDLVRDKISRGESLKSLGGFPRVTYFSTRDVNNEETVRIVENFAPDLIVSTFTMHILKNPLLSLPKLGAIGVHPSLLPSYRGLEVFFWMLANGEKTGGTTVFELSEKVDQGLILRQVEWEILPTETVRSIYAKLTESAAQVLISVLEDYPSLEAYEVPCERVETYFPMPTRTAYKRFVRSGRRW